MKLLKSRSLFTWVILLLTPFLFMNCGNQGNRENLEQRKIAVRDSLQTARDNIQQQIDQVDRQLTDLQRQKQDRFEEADETQRRNWDNMENELSQQRDNLRMRQRQLDNWLTDVGNRTKENWKEFEAEVRDFFRDNNR